MEVIGFWEDPLGPPDDLADAVRRTRKITGQTQAKLAESMGVARLTVLRWENEQDRPTEENFEKLRVVLREHVVRRLAGIPSRVARKRREQEAQLSRASAAGGHAPGIPIAPAKESAAKQAERTRTIAEYAESLSLVLALGGRAVLPVSEWRRVANVGKKLFDGMPKAQRSRRSTAEYWGYDVGYAIDAAIRGKSYREWVPTDDDRGYGILEAQARLLNEVMFDWQQFEDYWTNRAGLFAAGFDVDRLIEQARQRKQESSSAEKVGG